MLKAYADLDPRAVTLVKAVKRWAIGVEVVGAPYGNLSSYALTLMAIYYGQTTSVKVRGSTSFGALPVFIGVYLTRGGLGVGR